MSQKLPVDGFKWVENTSQFNKDFIENYDKDSDAGYFLEVDVQHPAKLHNYKRKEILPIIIEQGQFTYSALGKDFEKQIKTTEDQRAIEENRKQLVESNAIIKKYDDDKKILKRFILNR